MCGCLAAGTLSFRLALPSQSPPRPPAGPVDTRRKNVPVTFSCQSTSPASELLARGPFRDAEGMQRFLQSHGKEWEAMRTALRDAFRPSIESLRKCFAAAPGAQDTELVFEWRLESRAERARASRFLVRSASGDARSQAAARACADQVFARCPLEATALRRAFPQYEGPYPSPLVLTLNGANSR